MNTLLRGKTIIITGAGSGIGKGIANACSKAGANVVIAARRLETGEPVAEDIRAGGGNALAIRCDVSQWSQVQAMVSAAVAHFGAVDAVVHNATSGLSPQPTKVEDITDELWEAHASVSLRGSYYCARAAYEQLRARKGKLIVFTSPAGIEGSEKLPIYAMVKAGQRGFAKSLAHEWGPLGINVNCISPLAATPAMETAFEKNPDLEPRITALTPMRYMGQPERDIGQATVLLLSEGADYIQGQTWVVDGGRFMGL